MHYIGTGFCLCNVQHEKSEDLACHSTIVYYAKIERKKKYSKLNTVEEIDFFQIVQMKNVFIPK